MSVIHTYKNNIINISIQYRTKVKSVCLIRKSEMIVFLIYNFLDTYMFRSRKIKTEPANYFKSKLS